MLTQKLLGATAAGVNWTLVGVAGGDDTTSVTLPSGLQANDIGVLFDSTIQTGDITGVTPTNWTSLFNDQLTANSRRHRICVSFRILNSSLSGTTVTGVNTNAGAVAKLLVVIRPSKQLTNIVLSDVNHAQTFPGYPANQTITATPDTLNLRVSILRCLTSVQIFGNSNTPSMPYAYDISVDFGSGTSPNSRLFYFDVNKQSEVVSTEVVYGEASGTSYSTMFSCVIGMK
jgi:hypothetical protein